MFYRLLRCRSGRRERLPDFDFINPAALFLLLGMSCVEHNAVARLESSLQFDKHLLAPNVRHVAEENAAFFAEPGMDQFLVVDAAEPAGVKPAGKGHLHFIFTICDFRFTKRIASGA